MLQYLLSQVQPFLCFSLSQDTLSSAHLPLLTNLVGAPSPRTNTVGVVYYRLSLGLPEMWWHSSNLSSQMVQYIRRSYNHPYISNTLFFSSVCRSSSNAPAYYIPHISFHSMCVGCCSDFVHFGFCAFSLPLFSCICMHIVCCLPFTSCEY